MSRRDDDARWMGRALALARRGLGRTHPNPSVGAVLVRGGRMLGEGFSAPAGGPHAEIRALHAAGGRARGADLYVTLEPCAHVGRTPPCVDALLALGLRRVVIAAVDPNPLVHGRSIRRLRAAGVRVEVGTGAAEADAIVAGHRSVVLRGRPIVTLKLAATLDGRIATAAGDARWISGRAARRLVHTLRDVHDAVLVGAGTVRADDPRLTCRAPGGRNPVRVVVAGRRGLPPRARVFDTAAAPTWVVASRGARMRVRAAGVEMIAVAGDRAGRPRLRAALEVLAARGITSVLVEGGHAIAAAALRERLVDHALWFTAPAILGGDAMPAVDALGIRRARTALRLRDVVMERVGDDALVAGSLVAAGARRPFASGWPPR